MEIVEELDTKNKKDPGPYRVTTKITVGSDAKNNKQVFVLNELCSEQIRELAMNFGCRKVGSSSKFECRKAMAWKVDMGEMYDRHDIPNPVSTSEDLQINSLMRIINAAFHPDHIDALIKYNDSKKRKDFEEASGGNLSNELWRNISDMVNDPMQNDKLSVVIDSGPDEDPHLYDMVHLQGVNLNDFTPGTFKTCRQNFSYLMKARNNILKSKKVSGTHEPVI